MEPGVGSLAPAKLTLLDPDFHLYLAPFGGVKSCSMLFRVVDLYVRVRAMGIRACLFFSHRNKHP